MKLTNFIKKRGNLILITFFFFIFCILSINALHESYPDEFDNILGGKYILSGSLLYKDYFSHHGPVAYFLSAFILLFSNGSFVIFRILFAFCKNVLCHGNKSGRIQKSCYSTMDQ